MKKLLSAILVAVIVVGLFIVPSMTAAEKISVTVDGNIVNFPDVQPFIDENGRTLIPVRFVSETLGAKVEWDDKQKLATISKGSVNIKIRINDRNLVIDGMIKSMDTKAIIKEGRTLVPIRYVAEALGGIVEWKADIRTVVITTGNASTPQPSATPVPSTSSSVEVVEGIEFDRAKDVITGTDSIDDGVMNTESVQKFVEKFYKSIRFTNVSGKNYIEGYLPQLPKEYYWRVTISIFYKDKDDDLFFASMDGGRTDIQMYQGKNFKFELKGGKDQFEGLNAVAWVNTRNYGESSRFYLKYPEEDFSVSTPEKSYKLPYDGWGGLFKW